MQERHINWSPHVYQKNAVKFLLSKACGALFLDPGLGKTSITLAAIKILKQKNLIRKVLVIAPLRVCYSVWPNEIEKWEDFRDLKISILHGKDKEKALQAEADIFVINPEGLAWLSGAEKSRHYANKFAALGFDMLVVDELSKFKHTRTKRFKTIKPLLSTFKRRWGLTGSPAPNGLGDLFGQCFMIDEGNALGRYITHFRNAYFVRSYNGFSWELRAGADKEIYERIKPLALRMSAEDFLDMPKLIENNVFVNLPEKAQKFCNQLEAALVAQVDDKTITAATAATAIMKCRQAASGAVYKDYDLDALIKTKDNSEVVFIHDEKLKALVDLIDELQGQPVLVIYEFRHELTRISQALGGNVPHISGGISIEKTKSIIERWNNGKINILLGQPQSMGHGLNLQGTGAHIIWFSLTWDFELYDQTIRRLLRQGNENKIIYCHHILAKKTVDESILRALRLKNKTQSGLLEALKTYRSELNGNYNDF